MLSKLLCPVSRSGLQWFERKVVSSDGSHSYNISASGIPLFAEQTCSDEANRQRAHYDEQLAKQYLTNLNYPHTQEYMRYLDRVFADRVNRDDLEEVAEICCGHGEILNLFGSSGVNGVGVDISVPMLEEACRKHQMTNRSAV